MDKPLNYFIMKVLPFTIPVAHDHTIIVQQDVQPYFYPHLHRHEEIQLTWVQQGEGTLIADNNMHAFKANDIFWLGANQPHLFKSDPIYFLPKSDKNIQAIVLFFNPKGALEALFSLPEMSNVKRFLQQNPLPDDVLINKAATIERCIHRAREEYHKDPATFATDYTRQDAAILNIQRACEAALDIGQHLIRKHKLGVPQSIS